MKPCIPWTSGVIISTPLLLPHKRHHHHHHRRCHHRSLNASYFIRLYCDTNVGTMHVSICCIIAIYYILLCILYYMYVFVYMCSECVFVRACIIFFYLYIHIYTISHSRSLSLPPSKIIYLNTAHISVLFLYMFKGVYACSYSANNTWSMLANSIVVCFNMFYIFISSVYCWWWW